MKRNITNDTPPRKDRWIPQPGDTIEILWDVLFEEKPRWFRGIVKYTINKNGKNRCLIKYDDETITEEVFKPNKWRLVKSINDEVVLALLELSTTFSDEDTLIRDLINSSDIIDVLHR